MSLITVLFISIGLAMDAFAVSVANGFTIKKLHLKHALRIALSFGIFQAVMPLIGWLAGIGLKKYIVSVDHWIAFTLLTFIGVKMIYESFVIEENIKQDKEENISSGNLLLLSIATSIDALAVGLSLTFLNIAIILPALCIGIVTFILSLSGVYLGRKFGHLCENKIEIAGGVILILIGIKILYEHTFPGLK